MPLPLQPWHMAWLQQGFAGRWYMVAHCSSLYSRDAVQQTFVSAWLACYCTTVMYT